MIESQEVRQARVEEAVVQMKGDLRYLRDRFDALAVRVLVLAGASSVITALVVGLTTKAVMH